MLSLLPMASCHELTYPAICHHNSHVGSVIEVKYEHNILIFTDHVFDQLDTTLDVYEMIARPIIEEAMKGFNGESL